MSSRHVLLKFETPEPAAFLGRPCFRCVVTVVEAIGLPKEIFAFRRTVVNAVENRYQDEFSFICSPYDLSTYPVGEPHPNLTPPFFRKDKISILLPSVESYHKFSEEVKSQVAHLIYMMDKLDDLSVQNEVWIPGPPDSSSSSSSYGPGGP